MSFIIGLAIGAVVGWNFLPQPQFVADFVAKLRGKTGL